MCMNTKFYLWSAVLFSFFRAVVESEIGLWQYYKQDIDELDSEHGDLPKF